MKILRWYLLGYLMLFLCSTCVHAESLSWDAVNDIDLAGYKVYRSIEPGVNYTLENTLEKVTTYEIPGELASCVYWVVTAFDLEGLESERSNEASNCNGLPPSSPGSLIFITNSNVVINVVPPHD